MTHLRFPMIGAAVRPVLGLTALLLLSACVGDNGLDWDMRSGSGALDTSGAARQATAQRPAADARGVISYPGYQVAVARRGDTVAGLAGRVGVTAEDLARYNALRPNDPLREGEILALPSRVASLPGGTTGMGSPLPASGGIDVTTIATTALDRVGTPTPATTTTTPTGTEPVRHRVQRGETAFSIARTYNISARALADWNGLGPDLEVREGQYLIIPNAGAAPKPVADATPPGVGSPTPLPPSSKEPLPKEDTAPAAQTAKATPPSPDLGAQRSGATAARFAMPVSGKIIRGYVKKKNDGIDIAAAAGTAVKAAADGTVAAITTDTEGTPIVVIRHADNMLTVYAGVDGLKVKKGDKVTRGQTIAAVRAATPAFVHFEVRKGVDSVDPMPYLQ